MFEGRQLSRCELHFQVSRQSLIVVALFEQPKDAISVKEKRCTEIQLFASYYPVKRQNLQRKCWKARDTRCLLFRSLEICAGMN